MRRGGWAVVRTESRGLFRTHFPEGIPAIRNTHARACLKMVWFLDTKRSFSGLEPCIPGVSGCVGSVVTLVTLGEMPCMHS